MVLTRSGTTKGQNFCAPYSRQSDDLKGLKFLVTSRSDPKIVTLCESFASLAVCRLQDVPIEEVKSDIKTYLDIKLPKLAGNPELAKVGQQAGSDFLSKSASASDATFLLDKLSQQIMYDAFSQLKGKFLNRRLRILHTFLCMTECTTISTVAALVADGYNEVTKATVDDLHAVLYAQDDRVFWHHDSFPEFIFDRARSNFRVGEEKFEFWCNEQCRDSYKALNGGQST